MTKKKLKPIILIIIVMFVIPLLTVKLVRSDAAMAVCFIMFFAVNPVFSALLGIFAVNEFPKMLSLPIFNALCFLASSWIFFDMGEKQFIYYAIVYLIIGVVSALISMLIKKRVCNKNSNNKPKN